MKFLLVKIYSLSSIRFSMTSMVLNTVDMLNTMVMKHTEITNIANVVLIHSIYSLNVLATYERYKKWDAIEQPSMIKLMKIFPLNGCFCNDWCALIPKKA